MTYTTASKPETGRRNRKRKIIWFNPPYRKSVQANVGKTFLQLVEKHFTNKHRLHKIFNKDNVKVSYMYGKHGSNNQKAQLKDYLQKHKKSIKQQMQL